MNVLLINPPLTDPFQVPLGMATLAGFLEGNGAVVKQHDMSLEFIDFALGQISKGQSSGANLARQALQSGSFYDLRLNHLACLWLFESLALYFQSFGIEIGEPPELDPSFARLRIRSEQDFLSLINGQQRNPFQAFFQKRLSELLKEFSPDLIGISVGYEWQLASALTIVRILRTKGIRIPIYLGGPYITYARARLICHPRIMAMPDAYVVFEGEVPALELLHHSQRRYFHQIPNLLYSAGKKIRTTPPVPPVSAESAPFSRYAPSALALCLLPEPVLPVVAHRSACAYGRCAFCNANHSFVRRQNPKSVERLFDELEHLHSCYGCRHFTFNDDCVPVETIRNLSRLLISRRKNYRFFAALRSSETILEDDLRLAKKAGFLRVQFGFESASDRMLKRFAKNRTHSDMLRLLQLCRKTGIGVLLSAFVGFPGERRDEAEATIDFFNSQNSLFDAASLVPFSLEEGSVAWEHPERYGISIISGSRQDLFQDFEYSTRSGMSRREVREALNQTSIPSRFEPVLGTAASLLYLSQYGYSRYMRMIQKVRKEGSPLHPGWQWR